MFPRRFWPFGPHAAAGPWRHMVRPQLGSRPRALQPWFEPIVAACAGSALVFLAGLGGISLALFVVVATLAVLLLTHVFGIELDLKLDPSV